MGEELANSQKQISLTLMSQRDVSRRNADRAVDQMQQKFFMNGAYPRPQEAMAAQPKGQLQQIPQAVMDAEGNVTYINPEQRDEKSAAMMAPIGEPTGSPMAPVKASAQAVPNSSPMAAQLQAMEPVNNAAPSKAPDIDALVKKFMAGQAQASRTPMADAQVAAPVPTANLAASAPAAAAAASVAAAAPSNPFTLAASDDEDGNYSEYTSDADYLGAIAAAEQNRTGAGPSEFQTQLNTVGAPAQPVAVTDLVQSAQVMVRDGGGEMKVTLTPDGLGEVAMKVSVRDGKVSVQMITESDEAKKLIERQLGDLKTSLTSQHLSVDGIKVDTASNIGKQMEQQYNDAQRQMAQQTLEQFRQDQQGWRRSFFETPALKVYKDQAEAPRDIPAPTASSRKANNRRLDLVA
jgi:flagellar hook-length control protein FliK